MTESDLNIFFGQFFFHLLWFFLGSGHDDEQYQQNQSINYVNVCENKIIFGQFFFRPQENSMKNLQFQSRHHVFRESEKKPRKKFNNVKIF